MEKGRIYTYEVGRSMGRVEETVALLTSHSCTLRTRYGTLISGTAIAVSFFSCIRVMIRSRPLLEGKSIHARNTIEGIRLRYYHSSDVYAAAAVYAQYV